MFEKTPGAVGVPDKVPVLGENFAHAGRARTRKQLPHELGLVIVGVKEYNLPTVAVVGGDPDNVVAPAAAANIITDVANSAEKRIDILLFSSMTPLLV